MLVLVHGGLWDEEMDGERFWGRTGVVAGLRGAGVGVVAPDRVMRAGSWAAEAEHLAAGLPDGPVVVVGGSNGCSVAVRLALAVPGRVRGLVLAWPATAGDARVDGRLPAEVAPLLPGGVLRGVTDEELTGLRLPVAVLPSVPEGLVHQRRTADALLGLIPGAVELPGCPEPPHPLFEAEGLVAAVTGFWRGLRPRDPATV